VTIAEAPLAHLTQVEQGSLSSIDQGQQVDNWLQQQVDLLLCLCLCLQQGIAQRMVQRMVLHDDALPNACTT
jgi:hypothetical protein